MEYKGFTGDYDYSHEDQVFHGHIIKDKDIISYEGRTLKELEQDFKRAVDFYLKVKDK